MNKDDMMIEDIMSEIREMLEQRDNKISLDTNPYGFVTAWIDDDGVWWDKDKSAFKMGELTELCALRDTINDTIASVESASQL
jgi:hypothetical protein